MTREVIALFFITFLGSICLSRMSFAGILDDRLQISGYGNAHFMDMDGMPRFVDEDDPNDGTVQLREFSLFIDANIAEGVIASTEIEAGHNGTQYTSNYAYIDLDISAIINSWDGEQFGNLSFRAGKILVPFLSYNENKPNFKQYLMSTPFTAQNFAPVNPVGADFHGSGWSDVGLMLNWNYELGELAIVDLKVAGINGLGSDSEVLDDNTVQLDSTMQMGMMSFQPTIRTRNGLVENEESKLRDDNNDKASVIKLTLKSVDIPLDAGFSWYRGAWDKESEMDLQMYGIHLNLLFKDWTLKSEYGFGRVEQEEGVNVVADAGENGPANINNSTDNYDMYAWYVEVSYIPLRYGKDNDHYLRLVARYDEVDTNDEAEFTPFDRWRVTPGIEWEFIRNTRLRYEFQYSQIEDFDDAPTPFKEAGGNKYPKMHMTSIIFSF